MTIEDLIKKYGTDSIWFVVMLHLQQSQADESSEVVKEIHEMMTELRTALREYVVRMKSGQ